MEAVPVIKMWRETGDYLGETWLFIKKYVLKAS